MSNQEQRFTRVFNSESRSWRSFYTATHVINYADCVHARGWARYDVRVHALSLDRASADVDWHDGHGVLQGFVAAICKQSLFQHSSRSPATAGNNGHNRTSTCDLGDHVSTTAAPPTGEGNSSGRPERHNPCDISHIAPPSFRSRPLRAR